MKRNLLILLLLIFSFSSYSQQTFEKGYFINNSDQKITCEINTRKWRDNPDEFQYRLSENEELQTATIDSVKEFGISNSIKYIRRTVDIDRSRENFYYLSNTQKPDFKEEELFLKVLIEGEASLYQYLDKNLHRFFYKKETPRIHQLVFKTFKTPDGKTLQNNQFRQQVWEELKCSTIEKSRIQDLEYKKASIVRLFLDYNQCKSADFVKYEEKKENLFHITLRPRLNYTTFKLEHYREASRSADFGNKIGFGFGIEGESTLPFNTRKWAAFIEPTFQYFKSEKATETNTVYGGIRVVKIDYKSIELPVGIKYYFFLNKTSKLFLSASYVVDFGFNSSVEYARSNGDVYYSSEIRMGMNPAIGMGYKYGNYSLAMRYQFSRNILARYSSWDSDYKTTSLILGYSLF